MVASPPGDGAKPVTAGPASGRERGAGKEPLSVVASPPGERATKPATAGPASSREQSVSLVVHIDSISKLPYRDVVGQKVWGSWRATPSPLGFGVAVPYLGLFREK